MAKAVKTALIAAAATALTVFTLGTFGMSVPVLFGKGTAIGAAIGSKALQYASKAYALNPNKENSLILQTLQRVNDRTKGLLIPSQSQSEFNFVPSKD